MASERAPRALHERTLRHEWPAALQALWHAAMALWEAAETLEVLGMDDVSIACGYDAPLDSAATEASDALRIVEELVAPLLVAADASA